MNINTIEKKYKKEIFNIEYDEGAEKYIVQLNKGWFNWVDETTIITSESLKSLDDFLSWGICINKEGF